MADVTWQPTVVALSALVPWDRNPKTISKTHAKRMLDLWQRLGQFQTIAIGPAGEVYDGHQRLSVLKAAHGPRFEVTALQADRALTEKEREELTVAAHVGTTGQFDWEELSGWDVDELQTWGFDAELLQDWNTGAAALATMLESSQDAPPDDPGPQIDRADELREKWQTAPGQLWQLGEHRVICGDCTDAAVVARVMGGEKAGCCVTDPPYGVGVDYGGFDDTPQNVRELINGVMPLILDNLPAALTPGVPAMWDYPRPAWVGSWVHPASTSSGPWGFVGSNPILYYGKDPYLSDGKGRRDSSIVMVSDRKGENDHPVSKPLNVWEWLLQRMTPDAGVIVLDPFLGSGTTLIACEHLGRRCRGVEISPAYVAVTLQRWADMTGGVPVMVTDA